MKSITLRNLAAHKWSVLSIVLSVVCYLVVGLIIARQASLNLWMLNSLAAKRLASMQMVVALVAIVMGGIAFKGERPRVWGTVALVVGFLCFASAAA